jgi:hypothetical protein
MGFLRTLKFGADWIVAFCFSPINSCRNNQFKVKIELKNEQILTLDIILKCYFCNFKDTVVVFNTKVIEWIFTFCRGTFSSFLT